MSLSFIKPAIEHPFLWLLARVYPFLTKISFKEIQFHFPKYLDAVSKIQEPFTTVESYKLEFPDLKHPNLKPKNLIKAKKGMEKACTLIVIQPIYLITPPTVKKMVEWLSRYETLLLGSPPFRARKAFMQFASFLGLKEYYNE